MSVMGYVMTCPALSSDHDGHHHLHGGHGLAVQGRLGCVGVGEADDVHLALGQGGQRPVCPLSPRRLLLVAGDGMRMMR